MFISISYVCVFVQYHQMVLVWPTSYLVLPSFTRSIHQRAHNNNTVKVRKEEPPLGETRMHNPQQPDAVIVSAAVATRSCADCSSMEGHTSLSTAIVFTNDQISEPSISVVVTVDVCSRQRQGHLTQAYQYVGYFGPTASYQLFVW